MKLKFDASENLTECNQIKKVFGWEKNEGNEKF